MAENNQRNERKDLYQVLQRMRQTHAYPVGLNALSCWVKLLSVKTLLCYLKLRKNLLCYLKLRKVL